MSSKKNLKNIPEKTLARLHDRYYGHVGELDYFTAVSVATHLNSRLPLYRKTFDKAAKRYGLDWMLLAAMGYQESHWEPLAESVTGVRGLMMLTEETAQRYNVVNRDDPVQSIEGAARVLADLYKDVPVAVPEPDRSWMVLAAYNQGLGHLKDAMDLTQKRGGDPTHWLDVRESFQLLTRPRWFAQAKHGYVRGGEAIDYVSSVRTYYDIISWYFSGAPKLAPPKLRMDSSLSFSRPNTTSSGAPANAISPQFDAVPKPDKSVYELESSGSAEVIPLQDIQPESTTQQLAPSLQAANPPVTLSPATTIEVAPPAASQSNISSVGAQSGNNEPPPTDPQ